MNAFDKKCWRLLAQCSSIDDLKRIQRSAKDMETRMAATVMRVVSSYYMRDEGNENSGNHNHAGRPGEVGGSTSANTFYPKEVEINLIKALNHNPLDGIIDCRETIIAESHRKGGRHNGKYEDACTWSDSSLIQSIKSYSHTVSEHADKLLNPHLHDEGWETKSDRARMGLLWKWEKDLKRNAELAIIVTSIAKDRGIIQ